MEVEGLIVRVSVEMRRTLGDSDKKNFTRGLVRNAMLSAVSARNATGLRVGGTVLVWYSTDCDCGGAFLVYIQRGDRQIHPKMHACARGNLLQQRHQVLIQLGPFPGEQRECPKTKKMTTEESPDGQTQLYPPECESNQIPQSLRSYLSKSIRVQLHTDLLYTSKTAERVCMRGARSSRELLVLT